MNPELLNSCGINCAGLNAQDWSNVWLLSFYWGLLLCYIGIRTKR